MAQRRFGAQVYGAGVVAIALVCLATGTFDPGQPVAQDLTHRSSLAYAAATFMLLSGAAVAWRRTAAWGAALLAAYYTLVVVIVMNGRIVLAHHAQYGAYSGTAEQLALATGALMIFAAHAKISAVTAARLRRIGRRIFGVCAMCFGGAHFFYMNLTAPLVPSWLPPGQEFWAYATGIGQIAAGVALLVGIQARLATTLLTVMYSSFTVLVHIPMLAENPANRGNWAENALNLALIGVVCVIADSLPES